MEGKKERLPSFSRPQSFFYGYFKLLLKYLTNIMITYNSLNFNKLDKKIAKILINNNINIDDSQAFIEQNIIISIEEYIANCLEPVTNFTSLPCPKCGNKLLVPMKSSYSRNIIFKINNILIKLNITLPRLICNNCASTHSVMPCFCVPFKQYSKQAILEIVDQADKTSTQDIADKLDIEPKQVRRFVNLFVLFKNDILLLYQIYPNKFHRKLNNNSSVNIIIKSLSVEFEEMYFREFRKIYLYIKNRRRIYIGFKNYQFKITSNY